jgi:hypothetical protein
MSGPVLGKLIEGDAARDAIHVAIAPVVATVDVDPGQHVDHLGSPHGKHVGIVDPFLGKRVRKGEKFYLCLYANTVIGMRHAWQHPAFPEERPEAGMTDRSFSERWLRDYAVRFKRYSKTPDEAFAELIEDLRSGQLCSVGSDMYCLSDLDDADGLKRHAERYLGITIDWSGFTFSCSC